MNRQQEGQGPGWSQAVRSAAKAALAGISGPAVGPWPRALMYHSLDWSGSLISITPELFRQQMRCLKTWGWTALPLREAYGASPPPKGRNVVLTFDDGFANFYTEAFPVLRELGMTAAVFLVTDFMGGQAEWMARDRGVIESLVNVLPLGRAGRALHLDRLVNLAAEPLLTWVQVREMAGAGIEFHGHTASHPFLPSLSPARASEDLRRGMEALASALGPAPRFFAYPYGASTPEARAVLGALGCPGAFAADPQRTGGGRRDPLALPRVTIPGWDTLGDFRFRLSRARDLVHSS